MAKNLRLRTARLLRGMTQLQVAESVGRKEIEISRLETGRAQANAELKTRIAAVLGKPVFEVFSA